jgi:transcriptional regulator with XRE-family HTH domain
VRNVTNDLLDEVREAHGLTSDYALAQLLGVGPAAISNYRRGRSQMSDDMALRVAKLLGRPPAPILAQIAAERAKDPEVAHVWREAAKVLARLGSRGGKGK